MSTLASKFTRLKTSIGGNREKFHFEDTFGMPKEEQFHITRPNKANTRIISELEFALNLSEEQDGRFDDILGTALDYLLNQMDTEGVLTNSACEKAEEMLEPMAAAAKEYKLILASHAHIDMNWMWSYNETVAVVLATFRSILNVMDQYPEFCFSQSQGAVYKIVEEYDPAMMEEIKARIAEGRWEVTATAWVETDKNMPTGESLLRHIRYTKEYLKNVWGVKDFDIDFSPDTFGHNGNVPEINSFYDVKYYYHCRGNARKNVLYRYQAPSGKEVLAYREPNWYNGAITPQIGAGFIEITRRSAGLKTGLVIYGVGDHGGGPTRRDIERALEMMTWKIYPTIKFGTLREYFKEAETVREKLPVVTEELNYFAPGCYTTQSRIKRGNRRLEAALLDAETMAALAGKKAGFTFAGEKVVEAWQNVLFTHFHDILTGSCVQDSREHAMGLYQMSMATANTQLQNAMRAIGLQIDTSSILVDIDAYNSQSEGAGAGYGIENFIGVPSTERGSGRTRIFHVFNTQPRKRTEVVELTVWDWTGDVRRIQMKDFTGKEIAFQVVDREYQNYWDHKYIRVLAEVTVPAAGYTTIVLSEAEPEHYLAYLQENEQVSRFYDDYVLSNDKITVRISAKTGRIVSLTSKATGEELIGKEKSAGLTYMETETQTSNAWCIGRTIREIPVDRCVALEYVAKGGLRQSVKATFEVEGSKAEIVYGLDQGSDVVRMEMNIDWHGIGKEIIPVLTYHVPLSYQTEKFRYDIPMGSVVRKPLNNDVPGLQYGMAVNDEGSSALLVSDSKYGYRGTPDGLALTLINSATSPDPYPERGIHQIVLWLGINSSDAKEAEEKAMDLNHKFFYQPSNSHPGTLPMEDSLLEMKSDNAVVTAIMPSVNGKVIVRGYETAGEKGEVTIVRDGETSVTVEAEPYSIFETEV
ncbi:MAG: hypothetical protein KH828_01765 [Clostridiales bacterium]|nr:hypothetical protein [Clostridiales bacterium]